MVKIKANCYFEDSVWMLFRQMYPGTASQILENFMRGMTMTGIEVENMAKDDIQERLREELQTAQQAKIRAEALQLELGRQEKARRDEMYKRLKESQLMEDAISTTELLEDAI